MINTTKKVISIGVGKKEDGLDGFVGRARDQKASGGVDGLNAASVGHFVKGSLKYQRRR